MAICSFWFRPCIRLSVVCCGWCGMSAKSAPKPSRGRGNRLYLLEQEVSTEKTTDDPRGEPRAGGRQTFGSGRRTKDEGQTYGGPEIAHRRRIGAQTVY